MLVGDLTLDIQANPSGGMLQSIANEIIDVYQPDDITWHPGDTMIDIGAHVGMVSIYTALQHPEINILAYEPVPETYEYLLRNIKANNATNITPHNLAVTGDGQPVRIAVNLQSNSGGSSAYVTTEPETILAQSTTLNRILQHHNIERCRLLKLDAEGAEYDILTAAPINRIDYLRGEFHINEFLATLGHEPQKVLEHLIEAMPGWPGPNRIRLNIIPMAE